MTDEKRADGFWWALMSDPRDGHESGEAVHVWTGPMGQHLRQVGSELYWPATSWVAVVSRWGRYLGTGEPKGVVLQAACDLVTALVSSGALPWRQDDLEHEIREVLDSCSGEMGQADFDAYTAHCVEVNRGR